MAEPNPWAMRDSSKPSKDSDAAEASEASMNSVIPMANIRRKPMRSATADKGSRETTTTRLYAMTAQTTSAGSMDKACAMAGNATLAIEASNTVMVIAKSKVRVAQCRLGVSSEERRVGKGGGRT